jgi:hypothetical protein
VFFDAGSLKVPFISLDDLMPNKTIGARPKDKVDLEELRRLRRAELFRSSGAEPKTSGLEGVLPKSSS